ncbi:STAS domain-containing protein [Kocuria sp. SM24M-10]|uniref:STAS domain-containing protein n=1 Tax=Kocuria sp. SM24M-10 TaxID=1660349 RepID=UPI000649EC33|nr:STAS domain-containing protein [Kocuria sp. SM24M-10]KLU09798.1 anti-sigma factor antagonist [Kocuria sp. SM24M-10]
MTFTVEYTPSCALISGAGRLNMVQAPKLREVVAEVVGTGHQHVVIDMAGVEFVDSSGLGALVGCLKLARQAGGDLRIAAVNDQVRMVLKLTGMDRVLTPYRSPEDAFPRA